MGSTLPARAVSVEVNPLDGVRPQMAKADLRDQPLSIEMSGVVRDALVRHFGSLKVAAIELEIDPGQLTRELDAGKLNLARLAKGGAAFLLKLGALLVEHAQPLSTPKARARELLRQRRVIDAEFEQLLEYIA